MNHGSGSTCCELSVPQLSARPLGSTGSALVISVIYLVVYRVLLASSFICIVQISNMVAFYQVQFSRSLIYYESSKAVQLISKKNLGDALPVVRIIKVMIVQVNFIDNEILCNKLTIT